MSQQQLQEFKREQQKISNKRLRANYPKELTIVAEGDSWFDYPLRKDIIDYLIKKGYAVDRYAKAGDTLENMIYGTEWKRTKQRDTAQHLGSLSFQKTILAIKKHKPKIVLFSGGGNDIVGEEILAYLNHKLSNPVNLINTVIFEARLLEMKKALEFFIKSVKSVCDHSHILMDGYDYAKVNGKGYSFIFRNIKGPWLLPSFAMKAIVDVDEQKTIIKHLLDRFNEMLIELDHEYEHFHHVNLRDKFPKESQWDNEIHLKNAGFRKVANIYHEKITEIINHDPIKKFKHLIV